ncbi:MAG: FemAB family XrtA/PEP-CTERM system-associated protein [Vicinamibacterales bacterium]
MTTPAAPVRPTDESAASPEERPAQPVAVSTAVTAAEWDAYVEAHPLATADHLWHWREIVESVFQQRCAYLCARRGNRIVGVLPLVLFRSRLFGRAVISLPYLNYGGVLADDLEASQKLIEEAGVAGRGFQAAYVELRHQGRQADQLPFRQHKLALTRALPATVDALWTATDRKVRNQVRKAQKEGLTATVGGSELVDDFYGVFARNMRDLGTPVYSKQLFVETLRRFGDRARVHVVRNKDRALAASIAIGFRTTVLVPWASSLREFRHQCPNMLLYWSMLERATMGKMATFDFGRSSPESGPHHFKLQWGASEAPLHWEYVLLTRTEAPDHGPTNPKFQMMIAAWQRLPLSLANFIGPSIVKNIP